MTPFPWRAAMAFGLGVLRLSHENFWRMTPRELAAASEGVHGRTAPPATRAALDELMRAFPDARSTMR